MSSTATVYFSLLGLLLGFIQIKYQQSDGSPFQTHPKSMLASLISVCIYVLALVWIEFVQLQQQPTIGEDFARIFCHIILILAALSPVSLISVMVPYWLSWLPYIIWLIFSVIVVRLEAWDSFTTFLAGWIGGNGTGNGI